jgi:ankyrin repeat protein
LCAFAVFQELSGASEHGWTPLHFTVSKGYPRIAQLRIDRGANVFARNSSGKTPVDLNPQLDLTVPWRALKDAGRLNSQ